MAKKIKVPANKKFKKAYITEYYLNDKLEDYVFHFDVRPAIVNFLENLPTAIHSKPDKRKMVLKEYYYSLVDMMEMRHCDRRYILKYETGLEEPTPIVMTQTERNVLNGDREWMYTKRKRKLLRQFKKHR